MSLTGHSQDKLKFESFTSDDGLVSNYVDMVFVDSYGYLWICTYDGLNRYDGNTFKLYAQSEDSAGLNNNSIKEIYEDWDGQLWISTMGGVSVYDRKNDKVQSFSFPGKNNVYETSAIRQVNDSIVYIGTLVGLCQYNKKSQSYKWFGCESGAKSSLKDSLITSLYHDKEKNELWIGGWRRGLFKMDLSNEQITSYYNLNGKEFPSQRIRRFEKDITGKLWVATVDKGIVVLDRDTYDYKIYNVENSNLGNDFAFWLTLTNDGQMWACCLNGYLNIFDRSTETFHQYKPDPEDPNSISGHSISCIAEDAYGNLWISTHGNGISHMNKSKQVFKCYTKKANDNRFLNSPIVKDFIEYNNELWVATDGGGINILNETTDRFRYFTQNNGLSSNYVLQLVKGHDNKIYSSHWEGGVNIIDPVQNTITILDRNADAQHRLESQNVKAVCIDDTLLWIGADNGGVSGIYDLKHKRIITNENFENKFFDLSIPLSVNKITRDSKNRLWFATLHGLFMYDRAQLYSYYRNGQGKWGIASDNTNQIFEDSKGRIWLASEMGLSKYDESDRSFIFMSTELGMPLSAKSIAEDKNGALWISTKEGLFKYNPETSVVSRFGKEHGLLSDFYGRNSSYTFSDGRLAFGGINGFNIFHPDSIIETSNEHKVSLQKLFVNNNEIHSIDDSEILERVLEYTDTITLSPKAKEFKIYYSIILPSMSGKINYTYRLRGYSNQWSYSGQEMHATYTNLDPGTYQFDVATYMQGIIGPITTLTVIILPPWWETWWFKIGLVVAIIGIFFLIFYLRVRSVKERNRLLEIKVAERTSELKEAYSILHDQKKEIESQKDSLEKQNEELETLNKTKDKFFSIIGHDLKNPMNAVIGFAELLSSSYDKYPEEKKRKFIDIIASSSKNLLALLENLLAWSRSQSGVMKFSPQKVSINEIIQGNIYTLEPHAQKKEINLIYKRRNDISVIADVNMLNTVIRNLISNAIKFTPLNGTISMSVSEPDNGYTTIRIQDTGIGMTPEQIDNLFKIDKNTSTQGTEKETGTGLGLILCKEFIDKHNGRIWAESEKGHGSQFIIQLPL